jgi:hypothetical protein
MYGLEAWYPTSGEKRGRCPDFLYAAPRKDHVCGFHLGKPREIHQRKQISQEIRGVGHPSFFADEENCRSSASLGMTKLRTALTSAAVTEGWKVPLVIRVKGASA